MNIKREGRRFATVLTTLLLVTGATLFVAESPAQAAPSCAGPSHRPNGEGLAKVTSTIWFKQGPYDACNIIRNLNNGDEVWLHCSWINAYGNKWWYGRVAGTSQYGWIYDDNKSFWIDLDDNGDGNWDHQLCS
jgi:hypothetical protein